MLRGISWETFSFKFFLKTTPPPGCRDESVIYVLYSTIMATESVMYMYNHCDGAYDHANDI